VRLEKIAIVSIAFLTSALVTYVVRKRALARGLVDVPGARSSHRVPTPRGGGLAIVLVMSAFVLVEGWRHAASSDLALVLGLGGLVIALIGLVDDHRPLPSSVRLMVHFAVAIWAVERLGGLPPLQIGAHLTEPGLGGDAIAVLGIVWVLNLFNFMDGIDGIAATEAIFVVLAGAWLTAAELPGVVNLSVVLAAACGGFLLWNWPPARIFLGDVGSGYLGYAIAVLVLATARNNPVAVWVWLTLGGAFFVDATVTLARRVLRGEPASQAHRSHAYQWLARRWGSHRKVTAALLFLNLACVLPAATLAALTPWAACAIMLTLLAVLTLLFLLVGSGRAERTSAANT